MTDPHLHTASPVTTALEEFVHLDHLGLIAVRGADAETFLNAQLTNNVTPAASSTRAWLAGFCSPKGRLIATFVQWRHGDTIYLQTSRDVLEPVLKRLRMFVLRSKVTLDDVSESMVQIGFIDARPAGQERGDAWQVTGNETSLSIRYPEADGAARTLTVITRAAWNAGDHGVGRALSPVDPQTWRWSEIRAGLPRVTTATQDRFVPQMINFEALGGVDFKKGCFPGQEVVARSQYLGKLKRRMALAMVASDDAGVVPAPGTDVFSAGEDGQACGMVVNAERGPDGAIALLVELPLALFNSQSLRVGAADGPSLRIVTLPYPLPDNEVFVRPKL